MAIDPKKKEAQAAVVAIMKETETKAPATAPEAPKAPSPPPLPRVPRSPRRPAVAAREVAAQAAALPPQPQPKGRELPADPAAREAALAEVRPTAETILGICDVVASRLPPGRPLSKEERETIAKPLELVLYKYGGDWPPEWQLTLAVGMVAFGRWMEVKAAKSALPEREPKSEPKAAA